MSNVLKVALPGYNALTDTNPDHFALDSTSDDVLIKEFARGSVTLASSASKTIAHNLGYIPFFLSFVYATFLVNGNDETGYILPSSGGSVTVPQYDAHVDTSNLYLTNNSSSSVTFWYYIFYDKQK